MEFLSKIQILQDGSFEVVNLYSLASKGLTNYIEAQIKKNEPVSNQLIFRALIILLGNEILYDPTTLEIMLICCEFIKLLTDLKLEEALAEEFKNADFDMMLTAVKVL